MGDVAPYTGLGVRLRDAGHQVAIGAAAPFAELVRGVGLEFRELPGDPRAAQHSEVNQRWQRGGSGVRGGARLVRLLSEAVAELGLGMIDVARQGADVLLLSGPAFTGGTDVAEGLGIPSMGVFAAPAHPTSDFPPVLGLPHLGRLGNRMAGRALFAGMSVAMTSGINRVRARLDLPPRSLAASMRAQDATGWPVYYGFSPSVVPRPLDWRPGLEVAGYYWPQIPPDWSPPAELVEFLASGPPPVFVGFGSMVPGDPATLTALVLEATRRSKLRAVVQAGWAGLRVRETSERVLGIGDVAHAWLFPRMAAVVHHCGAGTTAAALRAGIPTVPVPVAADQSFWAARQLALGVSPAVLPSHRLNEAQLSAALREATGTSSYARRAEHLSRQIATEDGARQVVEAINRMDAS